ncbi:4a-hydroxytetrahydrobiopterin dehydratase [Streptomyces sp. NPDC091292]|uniref:4a-hydroxytetrahydrobiopterin dehydratase n=1 Tax=Streptomyces sp. NPDC091292 TaxID=3365991 RepID=UPI0037FE271F
MPTPPLTEPQLAESLTALPGWTVENGELTATYRATRARIPAFYADVAAAEDQADHHARITILYGTIAFALNTHDAGGAITAKDTAMATRIAQLATAHEASVAA